MSSQDGAPRALPDRPSAEHLRKQAKRLAKARALKLADAQRALARDYGFANWAHLLRHVEAMRGDKPARALSPLSAAARAGDVAAVRRLLSEGADADGPGGEGGTPLYHACVSEAEDGDRIAAAEALLSAGASTRRDDGGATPLHAAARRGPLALVELLIRSGALEWQEDAAGEPPLAAAKRGGAGDKDAIVELLDRPVIRDASFRAAVKAIHAGDADGLARLLDAEPRLLRERIVEPAVMTSAPARDQGFQVPLLRRLLAAGATASPASIDMALGHRELAPVRALLDAGYAMTAPIAAAMGESDRLGALLREASDDEKQRALSMAVINRCNGAARVALDAGADANRFLTVHQHSVPLHQAALDENIELIELLLARGARTDIRDTLWNGTPLGWARHEGKAKAVALLERAEKARGSG